MTEPAAVVGGSAAETGGSVTHRSLRSTDCEGFEASLADHEVEANLGLQSTHRKSPDPRRRRVPGASDPSIPAVSLPRGASHWRGSGGFPILLRVLAIVALWA
jgi:hypothetical protein